MIPLYFVPDSLKIVLYSWLTHSFSQLSPTLNNFQLTEIGNTTLCRWIYFKILSSVATARLVAFLSTFKLHAQRLCWILHSWVSFNYSWHFFDLLSAEIHSFLVKTTVIAGLYILSSSCLPPGMVPVIRASTINFYFLALIGVRCGM